MLPFVEVSIFLVGEEEFNLAFAEVGCFLIVLDAVISFTEGSVVVAAAAAKIYSVEGH